MELHKRELLIDRAKYLIEKYNYDSLDAILIAEQEFKIQEKKENNIGENEI